MDYVIDLGDENLVRYYREREILVIQNSLLSEDLCKLRVNDVISICNARTKKTQSFWHFKTIPKAIIHPFSLHRLECAENFHRARYSLFVAPEEADFRKIKELINSGILGLGLIP